MDGHFHPPKRILPDPDTLLERMTLAVFCPGCQPLQPGLGFILGSLRLCITRWDPELTL